MEIIKNNYIKEGKLIEVTCPSCGSVLKCTKDEKLTLPCPLCGSSLEGEPKYKEELHCKCGHRFNASPEGVGEYGLYYATCPNCNEPNYFDDGIEVTSNNLSLEHFASFNNGSHIEFKTIKDWISKCIKFLKENPNEYIRYICSGDSFVLVKKEDDEFYVMYADNYKEVYLKE